MIRRPPRSTRPYTLFPSTTLVQSDPPADPATARHLTDLAAQAGAPLLANAATARGSDVFNTSILWDGQGTPQLHDKVNPVPFGEYVPDRWFYERIVPDFIGLIDRKSVV